MEKTHEMKMQRLKINKSLLQETQFGSNKLSELNLAHMFLLNFLPNQALLFKKTFLIGFTNR